MLNEETGAYDLVQAGLTTNDNGVLTLTNLALGSYRLIETQAPSGYYLRDVEKCDIKSRQSVEPNPRDLAVGGIRLIQLRPHESLAGARFDLMLLDPVSGLYVVESYG